MRYRNIITTIAMAAAFAAASATGALARGGGMGGGGHMGGGMGGGHMGGWGGHVGGMAFASHAAIGHMGPVMRPVMGPVGFAGARSWVRHGNAAFAHHFPFRHRFVRNRFFFVGAPFAYAGYDDGCYSRVWTPWGWRWTDVCSY
jgi:hypothetical protein